MGKLIRHAFTGINIRVWKDDKTWFGQYAATYATAALNGSTQKTHIAARNVADTGRLIPGTPISVGFNKVTNKQVLTGSKW
jgi:hypothetical protein